jgi:hypothetical protein
MKIILEFQIGFKRFYVPNSHWAVTEICHILDTGPYFNVADPDHFDTDPAYHFQTDPGPLLLEVDMSIREILYIC